MTFKCSLFDIITAVVDDRCDMELDETDPTVWQKLEACVEEYILANTEAFKNACERLLIPFAQDDKFSRSHQFSGPKASICGIFLSFRLTIIYSYIWMSCWIYNFRLFL